MIRVKLALINELEAIERQAHHEVIKGFLWCLKARFPVLQSVTYFQTSWCYISLYKINDLNVSELNFSRGRLTEASEAKSAVVELDLKTEELELIIALLQRDDILTHVQKNHAPVATELGSEILYQVEEK